MHTSFRRILGLPGQAGRLERFFSKIDTTGYCWQWKASTSGNGYGRFYVDEDGQKKSFQAHRYAYELLVGPIPEGLVVDHLCRNRACVRPSHLEAVTSRENTLRGTGPAAKAAARTHCIYGHPFDEANTEYRPNGDRNCITCRRKHARKYMARRREKERAQQAAAADAVNPDATDCQKETT